MRRLPHSEVGGVIVNPPTSNNGDDGKNTQKKHWCFTWFNVSKPPVLNMADIDYMVTQLEMCPSTKRPHLQGYVELKKKASWTQMAKIFGTNNFWRTGRRGSRVQARDYCMKEGRLKDPVEYGQWSEVSQGRRTDLEEAIDLKNIEDIKDQYPQVYVKYHVGLKSLFGPRYITGQRKWMPDVWVFWGPTGTGKSHLAEEMGGEHAYRKSDDSKWWNGYGGHEVVIWEEFRGCNGEFSDVDLLKLLDRYPLSVQYKLGGYVDMLAKTIIFTSAIHPREWLKGNEKTDQLLRRIKVIQKLVRPFAGINRLIKEYHNPELW